MKLPDQVLPANTRRQQNQAVGVRTTSPAEWRHFPQSDFQQRVLHSPCTLLAHALLEVQRGNQAKA